MSVYCDYQNATQRVPGRLRRLLPMPMRRLLTQLCWWWYDAHDFFTEAIGWIPYHSVRLFFYGVFARACIGRKTNIDRGCRLYRHAGVQLGHNNIFNRDVLLAGRMGLIIGNNVSISEGAAIFTLEHDPNSPTFDPRSAPVIIQDRVFIGARAIILPGVTLGEGSVVAAGAVVTRDVASFAFDTARPMNSGALAAQWLAVAQDMAGDVGLAQLYDIVNRNWSPAYPEMSIVWLRLYQLTGEQRYLDASDRLIDYVCRSQPVHTRDKHTRGSIPGSRPIEGDYLPNCLSNWAVKFFTDALLLQQAIRRDGRAATPPL